MVHAVVVRALVAVVGKDSPLVDHMKDVGDKLVEAAGNFDKASQKLDDLHAQFKDIATSVASAFQHDLFGGSLQDAELQARADRNDAREAKKDLKRAESHGLDPRLARLVAQSGNTALIDQLAHATPAEIREFERLYRQRQRATAGLGKSVARDELGPAIKHQNKVLDNLDHRLHHLERILKHLPDGVEKGARDGTHSGNASRERTSAAKRRAA
jgi:ABC-type transporter Mla subunit MlaD